MKITLTRLDGSPEGLRLIKNVVKININQTVLVQLTEYAESIINGDPGLISQFGDGFFQTKFNEGYYRMTLWQFMEIFGPRFYNGARQIVVDNEIYIVKES